MQARLARAAERLHRGRAEGPHIAPAVELRGEQLRVFEDAAEYLLDAATRPDVEGIGSFGRIVLPPRTGKTVVAAHLIAKAGLTAAFLVPTRVLVEQIADELVRHLPGVPVGHWFGEASHVVEGGVNVGTYAMLQARAGELPRAVREAALVVADEAHHAMTRSRLRLLHDAFDPHAVRIALTATPDYDDDGRVLARYFPDLIHELTLEDAMRLQLLAPARLWVAEVDADGSQVRVVAGDFEAEGLGRVMSSVPFFRAVELYRRHPRHAATPALIACSSRQQAKDLCAYLGARGQAGSVGLVLGDTPRPDRVEILRRFERGIIDTLVQVGVLIEGWNSPRCKLLLDLAPSLSRVRATQKYFRVLTRLGDTQAAIYVFVPVDLPQLPVLPTELFGRSRDYACGELIADEGDTAGGSSEACPLPLPRIAGVRLRHRIAFTTRLEVPKLDPIDDIGLRAVVRSCRDFDPRRPCSLTRFRWLGFRHYLFTGRGGSLLRWLGVAPRRSAYCALLDRIAPGTGSRRFLRDEWRERPSEGRSIAETRRRLVAALLVGGERRNDVAAAGWRAASGGSVGRLPSPDEVVLQREVGAAVRRSLWILGERDRRALVLKHGLLGHEEHTLAEVGLDLCVSRERARQLVLRAQRRLARELRSLAPVLLDRRPPEPAAPRFPTPFWTHIVWFATGWIASSPASAEATCDDASGLLTDRRGPPQDVSARVQPDPPRSSATSRG
jgi:hypothetical protein